MATTNPEPGVLFKYDRPEDDQPAISQQVRDDLHALARLHYTTDPDMPANPRDGQPRVNAEDPNNIKLQLWLPGSGGGSAWRDALSFLNLGLGAPGKQVVSVTTPQTVWTIDHNIGSFVLAAAFDANGYQYEPIGPPPAVIGAGQMQVRQVTVNRVVLTFSGPVSGFAVIVG